MADLRTRYLGLELQSPLVASSSPLTGSLDGLRKLEAAGAGAVVLPSLFEEEIAEASPRPKAGPGGQAGYGAGPAAYLALVSQARRPSRSRWWPASTASPGRLGQLRQPSRGGRGRRP